MAQRLKSKYDSGPMGVLQWPLCGRREGLRCDACTDCPDALAWVGALAWASPFQAFLPPGGTDKGKDCSKVSGTHPGKAWWRLLGLTWLSALGTGLFWELSSQNTSPFSLFTGHWLLTQNILSRKSSPRNPMSLLLEGLP